MQTNSSLVGKKRRITGTVLMMLASVMLIGSAGAKLAHVPKVVTELGAMGFDGNRLIFIAILEILSAVLFLIPITRSFGLLMVSAYMGGAIATHVGHDQPFIQPAMVLVIFWLGTWLRHPQILWSSFPATVASSEIAQQENRPIALARV
jgi:DoxX-like protein